MKKKRLFFVLAFLTTVLSCQEGDEVPAGCKDCGGKVTKTENRPGTVQYDSTAKKYLVLMPIPGTIDSFTAGFACDIPLAYRQVGRQVVVSGTFYETTLRHSQKFCCVDENYCLILSTIAEP